MADVAHPLGVGSSAAPAADDVDDELDDEEALALLAGGARRARKAGQPSKAQKRKQKEKERRAKERSEPPGAGAGSSACDSSGAEAARGSDSSRSEEPAVQIEYVTVDSTKQLEALAAEDSELAPFVDVFKRFNGGGGDEASGASEPGGPRSSSADAHGDTTTTIEGDDDDDDHEGGDGSGDGSGKPRLSKRERRRLLQLSVAELKRGVAHPEVVEAHDVTSPDPTLLVALKALRNTVPVPRHWSAKRKYLQGKRGIEKPPFVLPDFITATGITKLRGADQEAAESKTLKAKTRDRFLPKMGRIEIDYAVLHDAFFKHQTKPHLTRAGELYYEGKEFEAKARSSRPGVISARLAAALGIDGPGPGPAFGPLPPPWLVPMQRYGPPPSLGHVRFPGLNAPLPKGAQYGYQPGGWGKPPVDPFGRPLYGDVFGVYEGPSPSGILPPPAAAAAGAAGGGGAAEGGGGGDGAGGSGPVKVKRRHWGEPPLPASSAPSSTGGDGSSAAPLPPGPQPGQGGEEEVEGLILAPPPPPPPSGGGLQPPSSSSGTGTMTPLEGGLLSVAPPLSISGMSGLETPDVLELRKGGSAAAAAGPPQELYKVLAEKRTALTGGLLGTTHAYVIGGSSGSSGAAPAPSGGGSGAGPAGKGEPAGVAIALNPDELAELDEGALARKYEEQVAASSAASGRDDIADLLEEQERKRKRKLEGGAAGNKAKKAKEFKF